MFVHDTDLMEVKVYCRKNGFKYEAITEKEYAKLKEEIKPKYSVLTVKMMQLSWELYNLLQDEAYVNDANGDRHFSFKLFKENRMKKLIKEWDAKSGEGKAIPVSPAAIGHLVPGVAEAILRAYDEMTVMGDEEEKK